MIKYYTNRDLSERLETKLAKWKRWSREFLPPDPLGGMQSGYSRQYTPDEAFTVYLGGHLVSDLHFTIPETRQILQDLGEWLSENGFEFRAGPLTKTADLQRNDPIHHYQIFIIPTVQDSMSHASERDNDRALFRYSIRGILPEHSLPEMNSGAKVIRFIETVLPEHPIDSPLLEDLKIVKLLNITALLRHFTTRLDLELTDYPVFV
jgi:hypothetical protein